MRPLLSRVTGTRLVAVVTATSCYRTKLMYELIAEHCPTTLLLAVHDRACPRPPPDVGIGFPLTISSADVIPMLVDMRHDLLRDWSHINFIYDKTVDRDTLHDAVDSLAQSHGHLAKPTSVVTYRVDVLRKRMTPKVDGAVPVGETIADHSKCMNQGAKGRFSAKHLVRHIESDKDMTHLVLMGNPRTVETVIEEAHNRSLMSLPRRWLFILTEPVARAKKYWSNLGPLLATGDTAVIQREVNQYGQCSEFGEGCQLRLAFTVLHEALHRLAETSDTEDKTLVNFDFRDNPLTKVKTYRRHTKNRLLKEIRSQLTHEVSETAHCGTCDRFAVQSFEKTAPKVDPTPWIKKKPKEKSVWIADQDFEVRVQKMNKWSPYKGLEIKKMALLQSDETGSHASREIRVGVFQQLPRIRVEKQGDKCLVSGVTHDILNTSATHLNFTIKWVCDYEEEQFGHLVDGKWTGLIGAVERGEVLIGANFFWKLPSRMKNDKVIWSRPFSEESVGFMVQKSTEDHKWLFLLPFTWDSWWAVTISTILIGPLVYYINTYSKFYDYHNLRNGKGLFKFENCAWYCYGAIVGQGGEHLPEALSGRTIVSFWWLFVIVTATTYSGNLVAVLTFPKVMQPIQNVRDLTSDWWISWATQKNSDISEVLEHDKWSDLAKLKEGMQYLDWDTDKNMIIRKAGDQKLAWIASDEQIKHIVSTNYLSTNICTLHLAMETIYRTQVHFLFNKNIGIETVKNINNEIEELGIIGLIAHWMRHYAQLGNDCLKPLIIYAGDVRKIECLHMYGSYVVLAAGLVASFFVFGGEVSYVKFFKKKEPTQSQNPLQSLYGLKATGVGYIGRVGTPTSRQQLLAPGQNKAANLNFVQPIVRDVDMRNKFNRAAVRPVAMPTLEQLQQSPPGGPAYSPPTGNPFNSNANFDYYSYEQHKTNFKSKFGMQ
ncbi:Glutamate receptor ionotropic, kainate 3 [Halotydeus destructor]|nr:Glutamate receptor ionotropic, kainate 3 [Halotydeus destructor]